MSTSSRTDLLTAATLCILALSVPYGNHAEAQELLSNPGFESGALAPWTTNGTWTVTSSGCHSGAHCATDVGNFYIEQTFPPVPGSSVSSFTFWMRQPEPGASAVVFYYTDGSSAYGSTTFPSAAWTRFDKTAEIDDTKTLSAIRIWGYSGAGPAEDVTFLDDVSLVGPLAAPTISSVSPSSGPDTGGVAVTISGTNLAGATSVTFGGAPGVITAITDTSLTVTAPPHAVGGVDVTVTTAGGSATLAAGFFYLGEAVVPMLTGGMMGLLAAALAGIAVWKLRS